MIILKKIATFTASLLQYRATLIYIARLNANRDNTLKDYIVVDNIFNLPIGKFIQYDGVNEIQKVSTRFLGSFQILFYGTDALPNSIKWQNLLASEASFELQRSLGITIYRTSSHNNLRIEDGTNYDNLYQCDFKVKYDETTEIPTLRIDTADISFINNV